MSDNKHEETMEEFRSVVARAFERQNPFGQLRATQADSRRRLAGKARTKITEGKWKLGKQEVQRISENLYQIIEDVTQAVDGRGRITKNAILEKAALSDGSGKSKLLHDLTLPAGVSEPQLGKRLARLTQDSRRRLRIAEAAACLGGIDADDIVLRLIAGTTLEIDHQLTPDEELNENLHALAKAIHGEASRIVELHDIKAYFRIIEEQGLSPCAKDSWVANGSDLWMRDTLPRVDLITLPTGQLPLAGTWRADDYPEPEAVEVESCKRFSLVLAPLAANGETRAFLATRIVLRIRWNRPLTGKWFRLGKEEFLELPTERAHAAGRLGRLTLTDADHKRLADEHVLPDLPENGWTLEEVTAHSLEVAFNRDIELWGSDKDELGHRLTGFSILPGATLLGHLERSLLHGRDHGKPETRLTALLEDDAKRRVGSLKDWVDDQRARNAAAMHRLSVGDGL